MRLRAPSVIAALAALGCAAQTLGHGPPLPLAVWGDFGASPARCQRALGTAAAQCALRVWVARRACVEPQLSGEPCDRNAMALAAREAREQAVEKADRLCSETDATSLQFLGSAEAFADITSVCRQIERALITAVYGPALIDVIGPTAEEVDAPARSCVIAAADAATAVLRLAMREQRTPLDSFAADRFATDAKTRYVARAGARVGRAADRFGARLAERCDPAAFEALYLRGLERFIDDLASRGECLAGGVYVQDGVVCGPPVCGNGMEEPAEDCDDGNRIDDDGCRNDCTFNDS